MSDVGASGFDDAELFRLARRGEHRALRLAEVDVDAAGSVELEDDPADTSCAEHRWKAGRHDVAAAIFSDELRSCLVADPCEDQIQIGFGYRTRQIDAHHALRGDRQVQILETKIKSRLGFHRVSSLWFGKRYHYLVKMSICYPRQPLPKPVP